MREFPAPPALASAIFLHHEASEANRQNAQLSLNLGEAFPVAQLQEAWNAVTAASPSLVHCIDPSAGLEVTLRESESVKPSWQHLDWSSQERSEIPALWNKVLVEEAGRAFDLSRPPHFRGTSIELPGGSCHLLLTFPNFLLDDEAVFSLTGQFLQVLEGQVPVTGTLDGSSATKEDTSWWSDLLQKATPARVEVRPRSLQPQLGWATKSTLQTREESRAVRETAALLNISPRQLFLGVAEIVLGRLGGSAEGLLLSNPESSSQLFPIRFSLKPEQSAEEYLKASAHHDGDRANHGHASLPAILNAGKSSHRMSDFSAAFVWSPGLLADRIHDTWMRWMNVDVKLMRPAVAPLTLEIRDAGRFIIELHGHRQFLPEAEVERLFARYFQVLAAVMEDPGTKLKELPILLEGENSSIPGSNGHTPSAAKRVEERFLEIAQKHANDLAVQGDGEAGLTFSEVRDHAQSLAGYLRQENVADGWMIALCLMPTPWVPVATMGVLLSGNTCVPLDPDAGASWLADKAAACDAEIVICDSQTAALFAGTTRRLLIIDQQWDLISAAPAATEIAPTPKAAFLLSGTEQDAAPTLSTIGASLLAAATKESLSRWRLKPGSRLPLAGTAGTGIYLETLLTSLNSGATLLLSNGRETAQLLHAQPTHLRLTEAQWRGLILDLRRSSVTWPESVRSACVETQTVSPSLFAAWQELVSEETATHFFWSPMSFSGLGLRSFTKGHEAQGEPPIGSPTQGVVAKLTDACGAELPPHYAGDARIQLAEETGHSWIMRAWKDAEGSLHFSPMSDAAEILRHQPGVLDAHLATVTIGDRSQRGGWVVFAADAVGTPEAATKELSLLIAPAERPDFIFTVERLPLTHGGQISVDALPKPTPPPVAKAPEPIAVQVPTSTPKARATTPAAEETISSAQSAPATETPVSSAPRETLTLLHKEIGAPTLLLVHDLEGDPEQLRPLADALQGDWTLYATGGQDSSVGTLRVEDEAKVIVSALQKVDPAGPYHFFGAGYGAVLAYEIARQLRGSGREVHYLALAGSAAPALAGSKDWKRTLGRLFGGAKPPATGSVGAQRRSQARDEYRAYSLEGPAGIILGPDQGRDVENGWLACTPDAFIERINIPSSEMLTETGVKRLAVILREWAVPTRDEEE